jgi:Gpi18-like mannosyltransferase
MDNIWFLKKKTIIIIKQVVYVDSKVKDWQIGLNHDFTHSLIQLKDTFDGFLMLTTSKNWSPMFD